MINEHDIDAFREEDFGEQVNHQLFMQEIREHEARQETIKKLSLYENPELLESNT